MEALVIEPDDPQAPDVRALLERHLAFANEHSPPQDVHAMDAQSLVDPSILFLTARRGGELLGTGALKVEGEQAEIKSMHTALEARGSGVARAMLARLLDLAVEHGVRQVSLETGSMDAFAPARRLYESAGFVDTEPFGSYVPSSYSTFMTLRLDAR